MQSVHVHMRAHTQGYVLAVAAKHAIPARFTSVNVNLRDQDEIIDCDREDIAHEGAAKRSFIRLGIFHDIRDFIRSLGDRRSAFVAEYPPHASRDS